MESRSIFVTVLAWIFIVGSSLAFLASIMQVVMISTMFSSDEFAMMAMSAPLFAKFILQNFHLIIYGFGAFTLFILASSIAFLKRQNWARLVFIVIFILGVIWQLGGLWIQFEMFSQFFGSSIGMGFEDFERMAKIIGWISTVIALGVSGLFIWFIIKLSTQPIKDEFILN